MSYFSPDDIRRIYERNSLAGDLGSAEDQCMAELFARLTPKLQFYTPTSKLAPNDHHYACIQCKTPDSVRWSSVLDRLVKSLKSVADLRRSFVSSASDHARLVKACADRVDVSRAIDVFIEGFRSSFDVCDGKDSTKSLFCRDKGNEAYFEEKYTRAAIIYSGAVRNAPDATKDPEAADCEYMLPMFYGNRSAAYFAMGHYEETILDLRAALNQYNYGKHKSPIKLHFRHVECLQRLGKYAEARAVLMYDMAPVTLNDEDRARWLELCAGIDKQPQQEKKKPVEKKERFRSSSSLLDSLVESGRFESHPNVSSLSSKVAIQYSKEKGNHLVATEDIEFGDVLALATPYATVLSTDRELNNCNYCAALAMDSEGRNPHMKRTVPCHLCSAVLYCSEECRTKSWLSSHRFECPSACEKLLPIMYQVGQRERLALRIAFTAGSVENIRAAASACVDGVKKKEEADSVIAVDSYKLIYGLEHHSDKFTFEELLRNTVNACLMLKLAQLSGFCKDLPLADVDFLGGTLLRHINQLAFNSLSSLHRSFPQIVPHECDHTQVKALHMRDQDFDGLYPLVSLLNHSCAPNSRVRLESFSNFGVVQAERSIPAGTELTISYGPYAGAHSFKGRRMALQDRFCFTCTCEQCQLEWRDCPSDSNVYYQMCCERCKQGLLARASPSANYFCDKCKATMTIARMAARLEPLPALYSNRIAPTEQVLNQSGKLMQAKVFSQNVPKFERTVTEAFAGLFHATCSNQHNLRMQLLSYCVLESYLDKKSAPQASKKVWKYAAEHIRALESSFYGAKSGGDSMQLFGALHQLMRWYGPLLERKKELAKRRYGIDDQMVVWFNDNVRVRYQRLLDRLDVLSQPSLDLMLARFEPHLDWMEGLFQLE